MALDIESINLAVTTSLSNTVGNRLAQIGNPQGDTYPAIIREREDGIRPELHYITTDILDISLPSGWLLNTCVLDSGETQFTVLYEVFINIKCYGEESLSILQDYHSRLCVDSSIRGQLQADAGLAVHSMTTVKSIPDFLHTNHEERALFRLSYYVHDVITQGEYVAIINGMGEYKEGEDVKLTSVIAVDASEELNP